MFDNDGITEDIGNVRKVEDKGNTGDIGDIGEIENAEDAKDVGDKEVDKGNNRAADGRDQEDGEIKKRVTPETRRPAKYAILEWVIELVSAETRRMSRWAMMAWVIVETRIINIQLLQM